jgi:hypothetical protein
MPILLTVVVSRVAAAWTAGAVTPSCSGACRLGDSRRWAPDRTVFNVYEGLEMHGERG